MWIVTLFNLEGESKMTFLHPEYFWLLVLIIPIFTIKNFRDFRMSMYGYILTYIFVVLALSRLVIVQEPIKSKEILSDVIIAVDLSYSMQADDIEPTRLGYAKKILRQLVHEKQKSRFGVLGFTTNAIVLSPLTQDSELLLHLFASLDEKLIITKGSSVMPALVLARKMSQSKRPSVVILSDGGDEADYSKEARYAKENSLIVNVFMIATPMGGTLTLEDGKLLSDTRGDIVVSRANANISEISTRSGGVYTRSLDELSEALSYQENKDYESFGTIVENQELFYYFIAAALFVFLFSVTTLKKFIFPLLLFFGVHTNASIFTPLYEINAKNAYEKQEYAKAINNYKKIETNKGYFNLACGYYKNGDYEKALSSFERVKSSDIKFKSKLYYNIANTFVRLHEFQKAREAYLKSLTLSYCKEADENLAYIKDVQEEKEGMTKKQKEKKDSSFAKQEESSGKKKEGGSSNLEVSANASSGAGDKGEKTKSQSMLNLNEGKVKLSAQQYELINKRGVNEQKPW